MRRGGWTLAPLLLLAGALPSACGGGDEAGSDASIADGGAADAPVVTPAPDPPVLLPCADGWRQIDSEDGISTCDPWPEGGALDCAEHEAHFPGEVGCVAVGTACPAGDFADDLPTDVMVQHVLAGATGGDGTLALPFGTIGEANSAAGPGHVLAIGKGSYDEVVRPRAELVLHGSCVAETVLTSSETALIEGVIVANRPGTVTLRNLRISASARVGISSASGGVRLVVEDVIVEGATTAGIYVALADLEARGLVVRDTRASLTSGGAGLILQSGGAVIERAVVERNLEVGVALVGASATLEDVAIHDTQSAIMTDEWGRALQLTGAADLTLRRAALERNRDVTVLLVGDGTVGRVEDTVIRGTLPNAADDLRGRGIDNTPGAHLTLARVLAEHNLGISIQAGGASTEMVMTDCVVRDTGSRASDGTRGRGINVQDYAVTTIERTLVLRSREAGIAAADPGAEVDMVDVRVEQTRRRACADDTCADEPLGIGIGAFRQAHIAGSRFAVTDSAICGLQLAIDGEIDLSSGEITGAEVGACIQVDGYDLDRITEDVVYRDNGINLDATMLPVPEST